MKLDAVTGRITGKATVEGEYKVTLKATNDKGTAQKEVTVKIGDAIALTPSMGWNSWNCWGLSVNDEKCVTQPHDERKTACLRMGIREYR